MLAVERVSASAIEMLCMRIVGNKETEEFETSRHKGRNKVLRTMHPWSTLDPLRLHAVTINFYFGHGIDRPYFRGYDWIQGEQIEY